MVFPNGRKGYIVDHICALAQGDLDNPINMQYQTLEESKGKDRIENTAYGAALFCNATNSTLTRQVLSVRSKALSRTIENMLLNNLEM